MSFCLYTVATGKYAKMAENLIISIREHGVGYDFVALSDRPVMGATETIEMGTEDRDGAYAQKVESLGLVVLDGVRVLGHFCFRSKKIVMEYKPKQ